MKNFLIAIWTTLAMAPVLPAAYVSAEARTEAQERLRNATAVLQEVMKAPDDGIPESLLEQAHCAVIVPGLKKGAFIVSAQYGRGFMTCRNTKTGGWSAPAAIRMEGGGVGFQIGASETDVVMLVMNERGSERLMQSQFTLGGTGEVAAGPVGRSTTAQTDAKMTAEILSWSRSRGVFAGVSLNGATLREDQETNEALYGSSMSTRQIVTSNLKAPPAGQPLITELNKYSFHERP